MNQQYLESAEKSQSYVLTIQINQFITMSSPLQVHLKYLFVDTYNAAPIYLGYNCYINRKVVSFPILNDGP